MANTYKNIVITPNIGNTSDPKIVFSGANATVNTDITLYTYPDANGTLSFEGSAGQLFSITNDLSNNLFGVNDVSGIPSLEVYANGLVSIAPFSGNVGIGNTSPNDKLSVNGSIKATSYIDSDLAFRGQASDTASIPSFTWTGETNTGIFRPAANSIGFSTGGTQKAVIDPSGNVGINNTAPTDKLSVNGTTYLGGNVTATSNLFVTNVVNAASHTVGTSTIANSTGVYTGVVNGSSHTVGTSFTANSTVVNAVSYYAGATLIGNSTGPYGKTEATLNVNSAVNANNADYLDGQHGAYYTNATNISTGTLAAARGGTNSTLTPVSGGVVYSNATGMAITTAGTNTYVLTSNGSAPVFAQIDMSYLPESTFKKSVRATTTADLSAASATAQVLTGGLVALPAQDGITLALNDRLLVKDQSNTAQNGIFYVSNTGSAATYAWTLTRVNDANTSSKIASALVAVDSGTINGGKLFDNDFKTTDTLGTTAMNWSYNIDAGGGVFVGSVYPNSNTLLLGNSISRWVVSANTVDASGLITGAAGATITGTTNTSTAFQISTTFIANTTGVYHTGTMNAASHTVGTSTIANSTGVYTGIVNAASHTVGTAFTANATVVNAVSYYAGTTLIGNTTGPYGKTEATLNVNSALTANNSTNLGGTAASGYQTTAGLSANVATLSANNADYLDGQHGTYYTNATNISTGTLSAARGGTNSSLTAVSGGVVYSNATGMAITAAGTNTYVLTSNGSAPVWAQIDMSYLPEATYKKSCRAATTADLSAASATAQVLTGGLVALPAQDGITLALNDRLLVKNQSNTAQNGIFYVSNTGSAATYAWTLTRSNDANTSSKIASALVAVDSGTINGGKLFDNDFKTTDTIGTTAVSWNYNIDGGGGVFTGSVYPNSNTLLLGNATSRWVISANTINTSGTTTAPVLFLDRITAAGRGINWYGTGYTAWQDYMAPAGAGQGWTATVTAPAGSYVTSWARRSFIENATGYGWTWEAGGGNSTTPSLVAELSSVTGNFRTIGSIYSGSTLIGNTTGPYGKTEGTLSVNNSVNLNGQAATYYTNATNMASGTLSAARGGTNSALTPVSGGVVYSNATGMAITTAGTNTFVLASNGTVPAWTQIDLSYLPEATYKKSCRAATTADLSAASATTQVLTGGLVALPAQDGITLVLNDRLLVKDQANSAQNGIFYVSNTGSAATYAWTLTRVNDANTSSKIASALVAIDEGTLYGGKLFDNDFKTTYTIGGTGMLWSYNIDAGGGVFTGSVYPSSNLLSFGNSTARWVVSANTVDASGLITGTGGATITGTTNTSVAYYAGSTLVANTTGPYGKTEATLNVNSATYATSAGSATNATFASSATNATYATSAGNGTKAWVNYNGVGVAIRASSGVTSVSRTATGQYTVNFNFTFADVNYQWNCNNTRGSLSTGGDVSCACAIAPTTTSIGFTSMTGTGGTVDALYFTMSAHR